MKRSKNRALSLIISSLLAFGLLGLMPVAAFAEEAEEATITVAELSEEVEGAAEVVPMAGPPFFEIGATTYNTLADALAAVTDGQTIVMLDNVTEDTPIIMPIALVTNFTLDMAGYNLDLGNNFISLDNDSDLTILRGGTLKLMGLNIYSSVLNATVHDIFGPNGLAAFYSTVTINGNITTTLTGSDGVDASDSSTVVINGNVTSGAFSGVAANSGAKITVNGNVTSASEAPWAGAFAEGLGTEVIINGNIVVTGADGWGAAVSNGGKITVNGTISATTYAVVDNYPIEVIEFAAADFGATSTKAGYYEYTDGVSFIWVLIPASNNTAGLAVTGDFANATALAVLIALAALGVSSIVLARRRKPGHQL